VDVNQMETQEIEIERLREALNRLATLEVFTVEGWGSRNAEVMARVNYARRVLGLPPVC
jgi:hypothetical protein